ncbi:MAG TPA: glutamine synthetase III [Armatimonadota bacterium]|nr:glutamine synthetase III [Armatimonadota bacterium]
MNGSRESVSSYFGCQVFSEAVMRERLPKNIFRALKDTIDDGKPLDPSIANVVANAMKDWAIEKGATHFCHWFQPMTEMTAEKHESFISPTSEGRTIMEFSGKELIQGEPDASSFPSGGLRSTFEARGYTAWDCTSPVFVKENGPTITLYIPSAFCSYNGQALDKKTPLLRSMDLLNKHAMRVLRALGNVTSKRVIPTLGAEQEYFLVDRSFVDKRLDLVLTGRTLFGAPPPKGQELEDHYYSAIHERVAAFMNELNMELWKLGVSARTQHNEVAPAQYELAPVFATVNVATDHNQLTMETMQKVALRHNFVCLLHEKPFAGVNGSGKHNNWSLSTDDGINLLDPGTTPHENEVFLIFLCAVIRAVDKYSKLLRSSVAVAGNDHRLGANEAPPAIISIFLGDQLTDILEQLAAGGAKTSKTNGKLKLGVSTLPPLPMDCTDRNRTSPFAFTGNKFEFRMVGSSQSPAGPTFILNTIVADVLSEIADELESNGDVNKKAQEILQKIAKEHMRIVFNGDNYSEEWVREAEKRGLPNIRNTVDSLNTMLDPDATAVFERHKVFCKEEWHARYEILMERYCKAINIEALTTLNMAKRLILPAAIKYSGIVANAANAVQSAGSYSDTLKKSLDQVCQLIDSLQQNIASLENATQKASSVEGVAKQGEIYRDLVISAMNAVRKDADKLEMLVDAEIWPLPTYAEMIFLR